jgi:hypothetical protein
MVGEWRCGGDSDRHGHYQLAVYGLMRKIILKSIMAGPDGIRNPGKHTVPAEIAAALVAGNHAAYADNRPPVARDPQPTETATVTPPETREQRGRSKK